MRTIRPILACLAASALFTTGCPGIVGLLESAYYPSDVHEDEWPVPTFEDHCSPAVANCPSAYYVGECATLEPIVKWDTQNFSAQQVRSYAVQKLEATCVDGKLCSVEVRGDSAIVHGIGVGMAKVHLRYVHPVTSRVVDQDVNIPFAEVPEPSTLVPRFERPASVKCPGPTSQ
jgi:hypothetical protein